MSKRYFAVCPLHDFEGQYRENKDEAEKDLQAHKDWFSDESHEGSSIEEKIKLLDKDVIGNTSGVCDRWGCEWTKGTDFEIGKNGGRFSVTGKPEFGIIIIELKLKNLSGGPDIIFPGRQITGVPKSKTIPEGRYRIIPNHFNPGPVNNYRVIYYTNWTER